MQIRVLFFASLREKLRRSETTCELPEQARVRDLMDQLCAEYPRITEVRKALSVAVNREYVDPEHVLSGNDEVALIPPVSGGRDV